MPKPSRPLVRWDERIARARALASGTPAASEALGFYADLAQYQRSLFLGAGGDPAGASERFADAVDLESASAAVPAFLTWLARTGPAPLARAAGALSMEDLAWRKLMRDRLAAQDPGGPPSPDDAIAFVIDALLQPYAEAAALGRPAPGPGLPAAATSRCPICADLPSVGALREEGQGARRMLVCARCLTDWDYLRVVCPSCGEQQFDALPVYTSDAYPHVRIEACDTCKSYLKTIDLTRDGLAVPVVDDIASLVLDVWAGEKGYRRLRSNLLRVGEPSRPTSSSAGRSTSGGPGSVGR